MDDAKSPVGFDPSDTSNRHLAGAHPLPVVWGSLFGVYLLAAFFLMAAARLHPGAVLDAAFGWEVTASELREWFFRYSVVGLIVVPGIFLIEILSVGWADSSLRAVLRPANLSSRSDAVCFLLVHFRLMRLPQVVLTWGFALISGEMVHHFVSVRLGLALSTDPIPAYVRFPLFFLLYTLLDYVAHRVDHSEVFWPIHRFHHAAEGFHVFTADRGHPASALTQSGLKIFPMIALGVPLDAIIDIGMLVASINYLNHSRIDWDFGWFGRYVIQSPRHHQLHHVRVARKVCNLSIVPIWDRLGGTWQDVPVGAISIGTTKAYRHGAFIIPDLLRDYWDFLVNIGRWFRRQAIRLGVGRATEEVRRPPMEAAAGPATKSLPASKDDQILAG
jgi:sterol desaturase/sphingolipid hydroxylase (fatty acid hydroxylase superfamily)